MVCSIIKKYGTFSMMVSLLLSSACPLTSATNSFAAIPLPAGREVFTYPPTASPVASMDPAQAEPIGVGIVAEGGYFLSLRVSLNQCSGPVDVYLVLFFPAFDPDNYYFLKSDYTFQTVSQGVEPWKQNVNGPINEALFSNIPTSILPPGTHYLGLLITPPGNPTTYYLWITSFITVEEEAISMITPYVNESDMATIYQAFSSDDSAPWGFAHNGVDFSPNGNLKPFQAVSSGVVDDIRLWQLPGTLNWQVNVWITYNSIYSAGYAFEPMSDDQADGQTQLDNMFVSLGQIVSQGDIIGNLYTTNEGSHVHFSLYQNGVAICPEPYFTPDARGSILNVIRNFWPEATMCY